MYIVESLVVLVLVVLSFYFSFGALLNIVAMVRSGQKEDLFCNISRRINSVIRYVFFHKGVMEDKSYGLMHLVYFYGFIILAIGHMELVFFGLTKFLAYFDLKPFLYRNFLPEMLIRPFELSQDFMAITVLIVVSMALFRRIVVPKSRLLPRSKDAETILWLIGFLYLSFFIYVPMETLARVESKELSTGFLWFLPISSMIAKAYANFPSTVQVFVHNLGFWSHISIFLGFAVYIPTSKHLHLVAAGPNIYFRHFDAVAKPNTIDFENSTNFGAGLVNQLSWKSLLDSFACTECGRCDEVCPAALTKKPLRPKKVLHDIKLNLKVENWPKLKEHYTLFGDLKDKNLDFDTITVKTPLILSDEMTADKINSNGSYKVEGQIHIDDIWSCTTCAACVDVCPVLIDSVPTSLIEMRRNLVMMQADHYPKELNASMKGMKTQGNPWGVSKDRRTEWANELDVPLMKDKAEAEYLFFVGCAGATDERAKKIQQALVRILKHAKVDFAILGCEEKCTGDPARRMGNEYLFESLAKENIALFSKYKFKKIFTSCPHCFNSLKNEYRDFGANYTVQHHTELIDELFRDNKISLSVKNKLAEEKVTFHDPCYLGRYNQSYEPSRDILFKVTNEKPKEMSMNKRKSFCCGAGGGRMFMEENIGKRINQERTEQAINTGAKVIATGCPFCMTMMSDGVKDKGLSEDIKVRDIAEIVSEHL